MSFNRCIFLGNLTRDPETRAVGSSSITSFSIAVNERWTDKNSGEKKEHVSFLDCEAWGKTGEVIAQYFGKGKPILVECKAKMDTWEDKNDGSKRSKIKFTVDSFSFVGGDKAEVSAAPAPAARPAPRAQPVGRAPVPQAINEDDIPFSPEFYRS